MNTTMSTCFAFGVLCSSLLLSGCQEGHDSTHTNDNDVSDQTPLDDEVPSDDETSSDDFEPDCALVDETEATENLVSVFSVSNDQWEITEGLPEWTEGHDFYRYFAIETWESSLIWQDGTESPFTLSLEEILNISAATPIEENWEPYLIIDAVVTLEIPDEGIYTTVETTIISRYSEFIWSMGGIMTFVVDEMDHCDHALLYYGRYSFNGPTEAMLLSQNHETVLQAVLSVQDD